MDSGSIFFKIILFTSNFIFKTCFGRGVHLFSLTFFSEKAKHLKMCPNCIGNMGEKLLHQGLIITQPYHWVIQSLSRNVCMVCVCAIAESCFLVDCRLLVEEHIANIGIPLDLF